MAYDQRLADAEDEIRRLRARLKAAEDVCLMYSWCPTRAGASDERPREKAAYVLLGRWADLVGPEVTDPRAHPDLDDEHVAEMASQRDATRAGVLAKLTEIVDDNSAGGA